MDAHRQSIEAVFFLRLPRTLRNVRNFYAEQKSSKKKAIPWHATRRRQFGFRSAGVPPAVFPPRHEYKNRRRDTAATKPLSNKLGCAAGPAARQLCALTFAFGPRLPRSLKRSGVH